jgi:hypothetical protein
MSEELLVRARKIARAIYIAADEEVADDVSRVILDLVAEVERREAFLVKFVEAMKLLNGQLDRMFEKIDGDELSGRPSSRH